ncbi:MAG: GTPase RsgA [Candidatus Altiarchaeota archaeon]|nr:GTPase RsgA [Candidatus Altiarchaeota archaeon]
MGETLIRVSRVINQSHVLLEVIDARFPRRSKRLKRMIFHKSKQLILVINKVDLVKDNGEELAKKMNGFAFSTKTKRGKRKLLRKLEEISEGELLRVGVIGRPNVRKSSIINVLTGRGSARTSASAGYTKGEQWVRLSSNILLIDSPGVITWDESEDDLIVEDALSIDKSSDPISAALRLFEIHPQVLGKLELTKKGEEALEEFAVKTGKLKKGGLPNTPEAAKMIIRRWQRGEL